MVAATHLVLIAVTRALWRRAAPRASALTLVAAPAMFAAMGRSVTAPLWLLLASCSGPSGLETEPWAPWPYVGVTDQLRYEQDDLRFYPGFIDVGAGRELRYAPTPAHHLFGAVHGQTDRTRFWVESRDWKLAELDVVSGALTEVPSPVAGESIMAWIVRDDGTNRELFARTESAWWRLGAAWSRVPPIDGGPGWLMASDAVVWGLTGFGPTQRIHRWDPATGAWSLVADGVGGSAFAIPGGALGLAGFSGPAHVLGADGTITGPLDWPGTGLSSACSPTHFVHGNLQSFDRGQTWTPIPRLRPQGGAGSLECRSGHAIERHDLISFERAPDGSLPAVGSASGPTFLFGGAIDLGDRQLGWSLGALRWRPGQGWALTDLPGSLTTASSTLHLYEYDEALAAPVHRWSEDAGASWQSRPVTVDGAPGQPCSPVVFAGPVAWAGCEGSPHEPAAPLLRSTDGGNSFVRVGTPNLAVVAGLSTGEAVLGDGSITADGHTLAPAPYDPAYWHLIGVLPGDRFLAQHWGDDGVPAELGVLDRDGGLAATYAAPPLPPHVDLQTFSLTRDGGLILACDTGLCRTRAL